MVTLAPMKFSGGVTSRLHQLETTSFGASSLTGSTTSNSSSVSSASSTHSSFRCKMHSGFAAVNLGSNMAQHQRRPPPNGVVVVAKERDLSSSRSPKSGGIGGGNSAFDVSLCQRQSRQPNVTNHLPNSGRRIADESPRRQQLPFNPGMTRKTAVTPRACRKAVVTEVRTDQARVVHQITGNNNINRLNGLPKFHLNENIGGSPAVRGNGGKCQSSSCRAAGTTTGGGAERREEQRNYLNSHTISSLNKISVKSSMSSSNTSRDTSIESIVPKYKTIGLGAKTTGGACGEMKASEVSSPHKRSYNPQMLVRTNKFILNDEQKVSRKANVIIPRVRTTLNEQRTGTTTHNIPIYRDLDEEEVVAAKVTVPTGNTHLSAFKVLKEMQRMTNFDQRVPGGGVGGEVGRQKFHYDDCDTDFYHRDPSSESLYIDFSKKRSPVKTALVGGGRSPLRPINKDVLLQRGEGVTCTDYTYQFEVVKRKQQQQQEKEKKELQLRDEEEKRLVAGGSSKALPSVFYVSCASWMPKCNNKFSLRERRLLEESKTISRKR